jgi:DNA-binding NarL/FixJ family response regulator
MEKRRKIRILVADDHFVVRMGLIALVNTEPDMEVVGEAADGTEAVALFDQVDPDLV